MIIAAHGFWFEVPDAFVSVVPADPGPGPDDTVLRLRVGEPVEGPEVFDVDGAAAATFDDDVLVVWPLQQLGPISFEHFVLDHLIPIALGMAGETVIHGAGVALDGRGLVLAGSSGAGKSTLALWMADNGWEWLGDDAVRIAPNSRAADTGPGNLDGPDTSPGHGHGTSPGPGHGTSPGPGPGHGHGTSPGPGHDTDTSPDTSPGLGNLDGASPPLLMWPSYPGARIHADGHETLFPGHRSAGLVAEYVAKERLIVPERAMTDAPVPLHLLVLVDPDARPDAPTLTPLSMAKTASALAQQTFLPRTSNTAQAIERLDRALALAPRVRAVRLAHPRTPESLAATAALLAAELAAATPAESASGATTGPAPSPKAQAQPQGQAGPASDPAAPSRTG